MKRILFSAVGSTDPIAGQHDGAILHIARVYDIDEIYLYYSKEMYELEQKDDRYCFCLEKLKELTGKTFQIHKIYRPELTEVHIFDYFLTEFRAILDEIVREDDCEVYLNVSSGTPAMKSALQTIGAFSQKPMKTLQVATPSKQYNESREDVKGDYAVDLQWELNLDNNPNFENRCSVSSNINLTLEIKKEIIKKHINAFDYVAALSVAKEIEDFLPAEVMKLLSAADYRMKLDRVKCREQLKGLEYRIFPHESGNEIDIAEYLLLLRIKMLKEEYLDFIRGITPLFAEVLKNAVENELHIRLKDYCCQRKTQVKGIYSERWDTDKVCTNEVLLSALTENGKRELQPAFLSSVHLVSALEKASQNIPLKQLVADIRNIEEAIRNPAAHCITYMTEDAIRSATGYSVKKIFDMLRKLTVYAGIKITDDDLLSYEHCNEEIIKYL